MWKGLGLTLSAEAEDRAEGSACMAMRLQGQLKGWKQEVGPGRGVEEEIQNSGKVWATKEMDPVHVVRPAGGYRLHSSTKGGGMRRAAYRPTRGSAAALANREAQLLNKLLPLFWILQQLVHHLVSVAAVAMTVI